MARENACFSEAEKEKQASPESGGDIGTLLPEKNVYDNRREPTSHVRKYENTNIFVEPFENNLSKRTFFTQPTWITAVFYSVLFFFKIEQQAIFSCGLKKFPEKEKVSLVLGPFDR